MENVSAMTEDDERMDLPAGFRFHPTDEELITYYLSPKVLDCNFIARAIGEVDLNKVEPWDLPWRAKMGEKEWYFFCVRDRKYPTGMRTNRATDAGYWKATGKDKEIFKAKTLVGMKKTLVFYKGRAPRGEKTNWVIHEYRLDGKNSFHAVSKSTKSEWVICRIFKKSPGGKKIHISGLTRTAKSCDNLGSLDLPPLMDLSSDEAQTKATVAEGSSKTSVFSPANSLLFPKVSTPNSILTAQITMPNMDNMYYTDSVFMQEQSILKLLLEDYGPFARQNAKTEFSQETGMTTDMSSSSMSNNHGADFRPYGYHQECPINSTVSVDLDCLWNY